MHQIDTKYTNLTKTLHYPVDRKKLMENFDTYRELIAVLLAVLVIMFK